MTKLFLPVLELVIGLALLATLGVFVLGAPLPGVPIEPDGLTAAMLAIVGVCWAIYLGRGLTWQRSQKGLDPTRSPEGPVATFLQAQVAHQGLDVAGARRLRSGAAEAITEELQGRPEPLGPPYWMATGQGVLVSLGLVGTFLGLSWGLLQAVPRLQGDPAAMQVGMQALLGGAKLAFVKSLAGVLCAMVWSLRYRQIEEQRDRLLGACKDWLDQRYPPVSTEELLGRMLAEQAAASTALAQRLEQMEGALVAEQQEILGAIGRADAQVGQVVNALAYVGNAVKQSGVAVVTEVGLVRQAVVHEEGAVVSALQTLSDDERESLSELIETVKQLAEQLPQQIGPNVGEVLVKLLGPHLEQLTGALKSLGDGSGKTLEGAVERGAGEAVTRLSGSLQAVADLLQRLPDQLGARVEEAKEAVQTSTKRVADELETAGKGVVGGLKVAATDLTGIHERLNESVLEVRALTENLSGFGAQIEQSLSAAKVSAAALEGHARGLHEGVQKVTQPFAQVATQLEAVPGALNAATEAMKSEHKALVGLGAELKGQAEAVRGQHEALQKRIAEYEQLQTTLSGQWGAQMQGVLKVNLAVKEAWTTALDAAKQGVQDNAQQIAAYATAVQQSITLPRDLRSLDEAIHELVDVLDDVKKTLAARR